MPPRLLLKATNRQKANNLLLYAKSPQPRAFLRTAVYTAMNRIRAFLFPLLFLCSAFAHAISVADITAQLRAQHAPSGRFTQTRYLRGMSQPLVASGTFALDGETLYWTLEKPFASRLRITPEGVSQWQDGSWRTTGQTALNDTQTRLFLAFLRADSATLGEYFDMSAEGEAAAWTLHLSPKTAVMRQIFRRIDIYGGAYVARVVLEEAQGDRSELFFQPEP